MLGTTSAPRDVPAPWATELEHRYPVKDPSSYTEFEKRYPPDRFGDEACDNARVWKIYRDRASEHDQILIDGWNKTLDILLIFAGLFSAVATAFIIEAYKQLSPDYSEYMALAYIAINGNFSGFVIQNPAEFTPSHVAIWTNGLWFASLSLALFVALLAILAKQWLEEYSSRMRVPVASHRRWTWRHLVYKRGLTQWQLDAFICALPILLHISLFLFFAGLVVFLFAINIVIAIVVASGTGVVFALYVGATMMPLFCGECPTATPLLRQGYRLFHAMVSGLRDSIDPGPVLARRRATTGWSIFGWSRSHSSRHNAATTATLLEWIGGGRPEQRSTTSVRQTIYNWLPAAPGPLPAFDEGRLLEGHGPRRDADVLRWMITTLPALEEVHVALDAIGSLNVQERMEYFGLDDSGNSLRGSDVRDACVKRLEALSCSSAPPDPDAISHCLRRLLFLGITGSSTTAEFTSALQRWSCIKSHDVYFMVEYFKRAHNLRYESYSKVVHRWLEVDGSTAVYHSSTLAALLINPLDWSINNLATLYVCGSTGLATPSTLTPTAMYNSMVTLINRVQAVMTRKFSALTVSLYQPLGDTEDVRLRALYLWTFALEHAVEFEVDERTALEAAVVSLQAIGASMARAVRPVLRRDQLEQCALPFLRSDFLERNWSQDTLYGVGIILERFRKPHGKSGAATFQGGRARPLTTLTTKLLMAVRRIFHLYKMSSGTDASSRDRFGDISSCILTTGKISTCQDIARAVALENADRKDSIRGLLLVCDDDSETQIDCAWGNAFAMACSQTHFARLANLARIIATMLAMDHCAGLDVQMLMDELLLGDRGIQLICADPETGFDIARHAKLVSPRWWMHVRNDLHRNFWNATDQFPDVRTFIEQVDSQQDCKECRPDEPPRDNGPRSTT